MKNIKKEQKGTKKIVDKLVTYVSLGVLILLSLSLLSSISRMKNVGLTIDKEKEKVNKLKKEQEDLKKSLEIANSQEYIEKQLRDKLGLAKEGEIVVILPDPEVVKKFAPRFEEEEEILSDPNWKKWIRLFF